MLNLQDIFNNFKNSKYLASGLLYKEDKDKLFFYELIGIPITFILASLLHFSYIWSNGAMWSIVVGAVNESVWEHVKIIALSYITWAIIEIIILLPPIRTFITAKVVGLYFLIVSIPLFFFSYTHFTQKSILSVDISSSLVFITIANIISYLLSTRSNNLFKYFNVAIGFLILFFVMLMIFTLFPPEIKLFQDPITGTYGIPKKTLLNENYVNARKVFMFKH